MDHAHALLAHLREDNPAPAWRDPQEGWLSYGELARRVARLAASYPDERSLVYLPFFTRTAHLLHYLAALKLGHVVMLADPALPTSQHNASCRQFDVSWRVNDAGQLERLAATTPTLHPELSVLLPTSGSTGSAKWVRLSGRNLTANAASIVDYLALTAAERAITSLPLYYSYGLSVLNSHLLVGASLVQHEGSVLERDFWQQVDLHGVSSFAGVPFTYQMLARLRFDWARYPSLQTLTQAGGRLEPALAQQFAEQALRLDRRFFVMYGQTEATARMAWLAAPEVAAYPDAIGRAIPGGQFALRELEGASPGRGSWSIAATTSCWVTPLRPRIWRWAPSCRSWLPAIWPAVTRRVATTSAAGSAVFSSCSASGSAWRRSRASSIAGAGRGPAAGVTTACWWLSSPAMT